MHNLGLTAAPFSHELKANNNLVIRGAPETGAGYRKHITNTATGDIGIGKMNPAVKRGNLAAVGFARGFDFQSVEIVKVICKTHWRGVAESRER